MNAHQPAGSDLAIPRSKELVPTVRRAQTRPPVPSVLLTYAEVVADTGIDPMRLLSSITTELAEYRQLITTTFQGAEA